MGLQDVFLLTKEAANNQKLAQVEIRNEISARYDGLQTLLTSLRLNDHQSTSMVDQEDPTPVSSEIREPQTHYQNLPDEDYVRAFHHNGSILFNSANMTSIAAVGIRTAQFPRTSCTPWCSCACHREWRFRTPRMLEQFIGSLFIGYSGLPVLRPPCNEHNCHLQSQPLTYVTYFFPRWFLSRMVTFMMTYTPLAGPVASLKVQRTVPGNADIFNFTKQGNVVGIRTLFENGLASPFDVQFDSGVTALHVRSSRKYYNFLKHG
jgi:hypothetical protein